MIENNLDTLWSSCLTFIYRTSSVAVISPGFTGDAKDALALFLHELHKSSSEEFLPAMNKIVVEFFRWLPPPQRTKSTDSLERIADGFIAIGYRAEDVEPIRRMRLTDYPDVQPDARAEKIGEPDKKAKAKSIAKGRPRVFLGSSVEGLPVAEAIQLNLEYEAECTIWHQGVFGLSKVALESLIEATEKFDFAVLVLTPDDVEISREVETLTARDNVLFELGLFMGALGRNRTFIVHCRDKKMKFPSDLAGVVMANFAERDDGDLRAALGSVCTLLKKEFQQYGRLSPD